MAEGLFSMAAACRIPAGEERYKTLTGRDAPVIEYLNQQESVHQFLASVMSLVDASVTNYQQRGFKNLMISFGCTGGQHRSVYLAENVAKRLRGRPGVDVMVSHRELDRCRLRKHRRRRPGNEGDGSGGRAGHALAAAY